MQYNEASIREQTAILLHSFVEVGTDLSNVPYKSVNMLAVRYLNALLDIAKYTQSPVVGIDNLSQGLDMLTDIIYLSDRQEIAEKMQLLYEKVTVLEAAATNLRDCIKCMC